MEETRHGYLVDSRPRLAALYRALDSVDGLSCLMLLGEFGECTETVGVASPSVVTFAQILAAEMPRSVDGLSLVSSRCVVAGQDLCILIYHLRSDVSVVMIGTPDWNVTLAERRVRPYLPEFAELGRTRRGSVSADPVEALPVRVRTDSMATGFDWARYVPGEEVLARLLRALDEP